MHNNKQSMGREPLTLLKISEATKKRIMAIDKEFNDGFEFIKNYPRSVTFFGSARTETGEFYYEKARNLAKKIVENIHYSITTGGGPGIMEAANRGAYEAGGNSIGLTIELPQEQTTNQYITDSISFHYFFSRKVCLSFSAEAYIFFPGGFGTLDEFLEILTLVQTNKIPRAPIILIGVSYWKSLENLFKEVLLKEKMIEKEDLSLYKITDDETEVLEIIKGAPIRIGLEYDEKNDTPKKEIPLNNTVRPISELSKKHCIPCEGGAEPLSHEESEKMLEKVSEWTLLENKEIEKTYKFKNFGEAINFINSIGRIAEEESHHPNIKLHDYKEVTVQISTHAIGGLSANHFILPPNI